jgi:hypothetical protein
VSVESACLGDDFFQTLVHIALRVMLDIEAAINYVDRGLGMRVAFSVVDIVLR